MRTKKPDSYHHGNLHQSLLNRGRKLLAKKGVEGFSLREVARLEGVSPTAVYHHFPDKHAFIGTIASAGLNEFVVGLEQSYEPGRTFRQNLKASCIFYIEYFIRNPELLNLLFSPLVRSRQDISTGQDAAFAGLSTMIGAGQKEGLLSKGDPELITAIFWSFLHGYSSLLLGDVFGKKNNISEDCPLPFRMEPDELADKIVDIFLSKFIENS